MRYLIAAIAILMSIHASAQFKNYIDQPIVEVNGQADSFITPDEIYIHILISEADSKDKRSLEEQESRMVAAFKKLGINTEKDLTTNGISSDFKNYFLRSNEVLKSKDYLLKVNSAVLATKVFIELEQLKIANANIDHVDHSQMERIHLTLKAKAVNNAKERAVAMAKALNQQVGAAIHIMDNSSAYIPNGGYMMSANVRFKANDASEQQLEQIEYDKIKLNANVQVVFILKP